MYKGGEIYEGNLKLNVEMILGLSGNYLKSDERVRFSAEKRI